MVEAITQESVLKKNIIDVPIVKQLIEENIVLSDQAKNILNNSTHLKEMGFIIFLDRYSMKDNRSNFTIGDLVVTISKDHPKYPKKDIGIVVKQDEQQLHLRMITGVYKDDKELLLVDIPKCDKPLESIYDSYRRVAKAVASIEGDNASQYEDKFAEALLKGYIQPAGRIMAGANVDGSGNYTSNLTLYNCYVIPSPKDSRKSIVKDTLFQMVEIFSRGGGVGINLSTLRPRFAYIHGVNGKSSGSVSWGGLYSYATGLIEQGGSRRGALMLMMADWHPDVEEFITSKENVGFLDNANISVLVSDEFMHAVKTDGDWNFEFPDINDVETKKLYDEYWDGDLLSWKEKGRKTVVHRTIKARDLWKKLIHAAWASAEPGIVFVGRYNKLSNSYYYNNIICTNPCGEQGLPAWGVCNLGHLALNNFLIKTGQDDVGPLYDFNWQALKDSSQTLVRFLDNVIDLTPYIFTENEINQKAERRVGCGTLGLAEVLIRLRLKFGSEEANKFVDELYKTITTSAYLMSSELAKEKGTFKYFDTEKFLASGFMQTMPEEVQQAVRQNGIRNVTLTTQAPTGTVGSMLGTSTGIEPFYAFKYFQQSRLGFHEVDIDLCNDYKKVDDKLPDFFVSAMNLGPDDHIKVQATIQRWTDSSISKTANVPSTFTVEDTMKLYEFAFDLNCKGVTIYRDNSRQEQILTTDATTEQKNTGEDVAEEAPQEKQSKESPFVDYSQEEQPVITNTPEILNQEVVFGSEIGDTCPQCQTGSMIKLGGCTECDAGCGFKGGCDMK